MTKRPPNAFSLPLIGEKKKKKKSKKVLSHWNTEDTILYPQQITGEKSQPRYIQMFKYGFGFLTWLFSLNFYSF